MPADKSNQTDFDLIIIGAGIHGAAIARHAALEGYRSCVVEQFNQPAMATSCKSSKLIHGGLRYLESFQFKLVKECLTERKTLLKIAPQLVRLEKFYIPVYRHSRRPALLIWLGLCLYRLLGGGAFKKIPRQQWQQLDGLSTDQLSTVFQYYDGVTDDQQLTQLLIKDAINHGSRLKTSCRVKHCDLDEDGASIVFEDNSKLSARLIINASGPWVNQLLENTTPLPNKARIDLVQGTHIVIPRLLTKGVYYFEADDGRVIFAIPWQQNCLIGTTETLFSKAPEQVKPLDDEIQYLLSNYNSAFNEQLQTGDIVETFAGLRVLPASESDAFKRARDTVILCDNPDQPRLISIIGGKLTAHRLTATKVMQRVHKIMPPRQAIDTRKIIIPAI